jgi:DNA-binding transcriptional regulator YiaG
MSKLSKEEFTEIWVKAVEAAEQGDTETWIKLAETLDEDGWLSAHQKTVLMKTRFKAARINAGLTQQGMSDLLDIPKRTIEKWEQGTNSPPPWAEKLIIQALKNKIRPEG